MRLLAIMACALLIGTGAAQASCGSGPDWCTDDPRIPVTLKEKKDRLSKEYPDYLVALLDLGVQCVARINQSPDAFTIIEVFPNGDWQTIPWDEDAERISKTRLSDGTISHFWMVNARRAFACDGQPKYDKRSDYIAGEDVNADLAIRCNDPSC